MAIDHHAQRAGEAHTLRDQHILSRAAGHLLYFIPPRRGNVSTLDTRSISTTGGVPMEKRPSGNPRYANGALRRKYRARLRAMGGPCGICHGRLGPIHYDEPSDAAHPLSFVIDEIKPVSKWRQFGYASPRAAAEDWGNLQPAHYFCNAQKGNKTGVFGADSGQKITKSPKISDGNW